MLGQPLSERLLVTCDCRADEYVALRTVPAVEELKRRLPSLSRRKELLQYLGRLGEVECII